MTMDMKNVVAAVLGFAAVVTVATLAAQDRPVDRAFAQYDRIAQALAKDSLEGVSTAAAALQPLAVEVGGDAAKAPATKLAAATSLEDVRAAFGELSEVLVTKFLDAELPGVVGFVCTMKKTQWAQRGETAANPYYGKAMATCGVPIKRGG
ncbi:MAG: hypothetical protein R2752_12285 [Vicinamibacterales bacterium]